MISTYCGPLALNFNISSFRLVVLRIDVGLGIFQPYRNLEAGDNQSQKSLMQDRESNPRPLVLQAKSLTTTPPLLLSSLRSNVIKLTSIRERSQPFRFQTSHVCGHGLHDLMTLTATFILRFPHSLILKVEEWIQQIKGGGECHFFFKTFWLALLTAAYSTMKQLPMVVLRIYIT